MHIIEQTDQDFPKQLQHMADPPAQIYVSGTNLSEILSLPRIAIVGSRKISPYGRAVTARFARELAKLSVVIISGLAFGVDACAHRAALEAGGRTAAVLACGVDRVYPASHHHLAQDMLKQGGALISEYAPGTIPYKDHFIARNRIVSTLADGVLITEAAQKSGSLHTARFALEQGKEVFAVPGNITSETSVGTNMLIRMGATPVTELADILHALDWQSLITKPKNTPRGNSESEQLVLNLLAEGCHDGAALLTRSNLDVSLFNQTLTMLEITGKVFANGGDHHWSLR